jgi:hypothetical protein
MLQKAVEQRRLTAAQKPGDDRYRDQAALACFSSSAE